MSDEVPAGPAPGGFGTNRIEAFSDAVMAVAITIMALELRAPVGSSLHDLRAKLPELLVYVLSFLQIAIYWNNHHHLFQATKRITGGVMWANMHLLFWLSLIPAVTEWVANKSSESLPAVTYGIVAFFCATAYYVLVRMIIRAEPEESLVVEAIGETRKEIVSLVVYAIAIGLGCLSPYLAYACFVIVATLWLVPDRRIAGLIGRVGKDANSANGGEIS
jgi:uncharacterized membrane protein